MKIKLFLLSRWVAFCCSLLFVTFSVHAQEPRCVLKGALMFDPRWVKQIKDQMTADKSIHAQWQTVRIFSVSEPIQVIYNATSLYDESYLDSGSIDISETLVECGQQYKIDFLYQIFKIDGDGASADIYFTARPDNKPMALTYPTDFLRELCSWGRRDCLH